MFLRIRDYRVTVLLVLVSFFMGSFSYAEKNRPYKVEHEFLRQILGLKEETENFNRIYREIVSHIESKTDSLNEAQAHEYWEQYLQSVAENIGRATKVLEMIPMYRELQKSGGLVNELDESRFQWSYEFYAKEGAEAEKVLRLCKEALKLFLVTLHPEANLQFKINTLQKEIETSAADIDVSQNRIEKKLETLQTLDADYEKIKDSGLQKTTFHQTQETLLKLSLSILNTELSLLALRESNLENLKNIQNTNQIRKVLTNLDLSVFWFALEESLGRSMGDSTGERYLNLDQLLNDPFEKEPCEKSLKKAVPNSSLN